MQKEHFWRTKHKLLPVFDGTYRVTEVSTTTVTFKMGDRRERFLRDRVIKSPKPDSNIKEMVLKDWSVSADDTKTAVYAEGNTGPGTIDGMHDEGVCNNDESTA